MQTSFWNIILGPLDPITGIFGFVIDRNSRTVHKMYIIK